MLTLKNAAYIGLILIPAPPILAQPGSIDPSFGGGTVVVTTGPWGTNSNGGYGTLNAAVVQSTGKVICMGRCNAPNGIGAIRFNLDGTIDTTFGQGGTTNVAYPPSAGSPLACIAGGAPNGALGAAVASNDRIVMVDGSFEVVRLMPDGALDATFGSGGVASMCGANRRRTWYGAAVAIQPDGKIVVAGYSAAQNGNANYDVTIARFTASGTLDTTFANFGHGSTPGYLIDAQTGTQTMTRGALLIQPDGRIVVAAGSDSLPFLARYLPSGAVDTIFGTNGKRTFSFSGGREATRGVALTSDGRIVLGAAQGSTAYVARYTSGGALDTTYGGSNSGWISIALPPNIPEFSPGIALQSDGSALLPLSWPDGSSNSDQATIRLTPTGVLDTGFGPGGNGLSQLAGWIGQYESCRALAVGPFDQIIMVGSHSDGVNGGPCVTAIQP